MRDRIYGIERETAFFPNEIYKAYHGETKGFVEQSRPRTQGGVVVMPPNLHMLANGSRAYWDAGGQFEIATPECRSVRDLVTWDKAGERILERIALSMNSSNSSLMLASEIRQMLDAYGGATFLKNNTGLQPRAGDPRLRSYISSEIYSSYGTHMNILGRARETTCIAAMTLLAPFLLSSFWFSGAGLLWVRQDGKLCFSLSQRAPFLTHVVHSQATSSDDAMARKPLFVPRPHEPHADLDRYFRVHSTGMDSCMSEWPTYVLNVILGILMRMLEEGFVHIRDYDEDEEKLLAIAEATSWLGNERAQFSFRGRRFSVASLHREYYLKPILAFKASGVLWSDEEEDGLQKYIFLIELFDRAHSSHKLVELLAPYVDWAAKLKYWILPDMQRYAYSWDTSPGSALAISMKSGQTVATSVWARIKLFDNFFHDVRRSKGLYYKLAERNYMARIIMDDALITSAEEYPPRDTRAYGRVERFKGFHRQGIVVFPDTHGDEWGGIRYRGASGDKEDVLWVRNPDPFNPDPKAFRRKVSP